MEMYDKKLRYIVLIVDGVYVGKYYVLSLKQFWQHFYREQFDENQYEEVFKKFIEDNILHHELKTKQDVDELKLIVRQKGYKSLEEMIDDFYSAYHKKWHYVPD